MGSRPQRNTSEEGAAVPRVELTIDGGKAGERVWQALDAVLYCLHQDGLDYTFKWFPDTETELNSQS